MLTAFVYRLQKSRLMLPLATLAAMAALGINEAAYSSSMASLERLGQRSQARTQVENVVRRLTDAETGQRGYLLTARTEYLSPYTQASDEIKTSLVWLRSYFADDESTSKLIDQLSEKAFEKLSELETTLHIFEQGRRDSWRELMLTDIGREKMDAVRVLSSAIQLAEVRRWSDDRADVYGSLRVARIGVNSMVLLSLFALVFFLRQRREFDASRQHNATVLQVERDQLEAKVLQRTAELTELAHHLHSAREDERSRIARNLHDELGALLTAAKLDAARLKRSIGTLSADTEARLRNLNDAINQGISLKRRIIEDLRPSALSNLGLVPTLQILTREFSERSELAVHTHLQSVALSDSAQITIYRVVQESLTNIAKYARASAVEVHLAPEGGMAHVSIVDDGEGFNPSAMPAHSHGLVGMRYRAEGEGGSLIVHSKPGQGTRIDLYLPALDAPADIPGIKRNESNLVAGA